MLLPQANRLTQGLMLTKDDLKTKHYVPFVAPY